MRLWADACVTPQLERVAHSRGYEATSNRSRGLLSELDRNLYPAVIEGDWILITNNEKDFRRLAAQHALHPGLVVLPQSLIAVQIERFERVLDFIESSAAVAGEPAADWMVCRLVSFDDEAGSIGWEWISDDAAGI